MSSALANIPPATATDLPPEAVLPTGSHVTPPFAPPFAPFHVYDWLAQHAPDAPAVRRQSGDTYHDLSNKQWAACIRRAAAYIRSHTSQSPQSDVHHGKQTVIAICAHADTLDYLCVTLGIEFAGAVDLQLATNNSAPALVHLIREAGATYLLPGPPGMKDLDARLQEAVQALSSEGWNLTVIPWPEHNALLSGPELKLNTDTPAPYEPDRPVAILHSSGTTGLWPKLRVYTQSAIRQLLHWHYFSPGMPAGQVTFLGNLPPFHTMAQQAARTAPTSGHVLAFYEWQLHPRPMDERSWIKALLMTKTYMGVAAPVTYGNVLHDPHLLQQLRQIPKLVYGGSLMDPHSQHQLAKNDIYPLSMFGATEVPCVSSFNPTQGEGIVKSKMAHALIQPLDDDDGAVEMLWYATPYFSPLLFNGEYDGRPTYTTGDRYKIVSPNLSGTDVVSTEQLQGQEVRFLVLGRNDDQVALSNGEKVNPTPILHSLLSSRDVQHVVVFGKSRPHPGVLIELVPSSPLLPKDGWDEASISRAREALWHLVQVANSETPAHARLSRDMILFASPDRPFQLTGKGSVRTMVTLNQYEKEVQQAYDGPAGPAHPPPEQWTEASSLSYVLQLLSDIGLPVPPTMVGEDLFQTLGADSVVATKLYQLLSSALGCNGSALPSTVVYEHPTPKALAMATLQAASEGQVGAAPDPVAIMQQLVDKYSAFPPAAPQRQAHQLTVIVTGTTGSMGCHLLSQLLARPDVDRVYALNRPGATLTERQAKALATQGLDPGLVHSPKLHLLGVDWTTEQSLSRLPPDEYDGLKTATHIIHAAWKLDFVIPVQSFEAQISGVHTLLALAMQSGAHLSFISSVARVLGAVASGPSAPEPKEEQVPLALAHGGYGHSKAVAEVLLALADAEGASTTVLRAGQLCGATVGAGAWNTSEWFPSLTQVSQRIGSLPHIKGEADWLPMDRAAGTVVDVTLAREGGVMHLTNPQRASMEHLMATMTAELGLPLVSPDEWMERLISLPEDHYAAKRLIPFFTRTFRDDPPSLIPQRTQRASHTLATTSAVGDEDVRRWIAFWRQQGFIR